MARLYWNCTRDLTKGVAALIGEVHFLNGGLFEETDLENAATSPSLTKLSGES